MNRFVHRKHIVFLIAFTLGCCYVIATVGCCLLVQVYDFNESLQDFFFCLQGENLNKPDDLHSMSLEKVVQQIVFKGTVCPKLKIC